MNFDLEDTRRDLIAMRTKHGADTPIGHRCSNIIGQVEQVMRTIDPFWRRKMAHGIRKQITELANLVR